MDRQKHLVLSLDTSSGETKLQALIRELLRLIQAELHEGDSLPSVNQVSRELSLSRDTVFKAYSELKRRKIVKSTPTKGYFVSHDISRVLLLLDYYTPFKDMVYREIEREVGRDYTIDLVFHHYNKTVFDTVVLNSIGKYDAYVIMNFDTQEFSISGSLKRIDPSKLLLLDIPVFDWKNFESGRYSYVWQDFDESVFSALQEIREQVRKYSRFVFMNPDRLKHPAVTLEAFRRFCDQNGICPEVVTLSASLRVKKGEVYFVLRQSDLAEILTQCREADLIPGEDIGVLAYNDIPLYEFIGKGITVISTDFKKMGQLAAEFIKEQQPVQKILPASLINRNSL
ncbi:MAG: GntR family transcriptional regulator [Bacteroidales bacterium]|nr:GntR family transcriptional regulator [Bacteroidales bacterium]